MANAEFGSNCEEAMQGNFMTLLENFPVWTEHKHGNLSQPKIELRDLPNKKQKPEALPFGSLTRYV
jgi:hypothetical protein